MLKTQRKSESCSVESDSLLQFYTVLYILQTFYTDFYTVHGNLQARILEWASIPFSRGSSQPREDLKKLKLRGIF